MVANLKTRTVSPRSAAVRVPMVRPFRIYLGTISEYRAVLVRVRLGSILTASDNVKTDTRLELSFEESPFYSEDLKEGAFHATVGMQAVPITIKERNGETVTIESEKPVAYAREDIFLLLDLNAKKARVIGKGRAVTGYGIMWRMQ